MSLTMIDISSENDSCNGQKNEKPHSLSCWLIC